MEKRDKFLEAFEAVEGTWKTRVTGFVLKSLKRVCLLAEMEGNVNVIDAVNHELIEAESLPFNQWLTDDEINEGLEFVLHMEKVLNNGISSNQDC